MQLAVIGLGKLGSPFAALLATKGHVVVGADLDAELVRKLNAGEAPVEETGLAALILEAGDRLTATTSVEEAVVAASVVFIVVPTPSLESGEFDNQYVVSAVRAIGSAFSTQPDERRVVVVTSTVLPGSMSGPIRAALEEAAGGPVGETLGLCYSPEFIALGSVVADLRGPDFILVGESSAWVGELVGDVLVQMTDNAAPVCRMSLVDAELTKIAVNTFVTTKISYANMLAEICARLPGADAATVSAAVGLDSRIGQKYLRPAAPYGGPCFPRDNAALAALARSIGTTADIAEATDRINRRQVDAVGNELLRLAGQDGQVGILGMSYKPGTGVADESFGVHLALYLHDHGCVATVYDPAAMPAALRLLGDRAIAVGSIEECAEYADVLVIATPWPEFSIVGDLIARGLTKVAHIIDPWRMFDQPFASSDVTVWRPGQGMNA
jgi:UDPglucose 6-dehydrogenase